MSSFYIFNSQSSHIFIQSDFKPFLNIFFDFNCDNIFKCAGGGQSFNNLINDLRTFFEQNFYELYLTSRVVVNGQKKYQLLKFVSTSYQNQQFVAGNIQIQLNQNKFHFQQDFFTSHKNNEISTLGWNGYSKAISESKSLVPKVQLNINSSTHRNINFITGHHLAIDQIIFSDYLNKIFVYHRSVDMFLAIFAGSLFLIYLGLSLICTSLNTYLSKGQNFQHLYLLQSRQNEKSSFKQAKILFCDWLKVFLCIKSQQSEKMRIITNTLDIVKILKNIKTAERNLQTNKKQYEFKQKQLIFQYQKQQEQFKQPEKNQNKNKILNLQQDQLESLCKSKYINQVYSSNLTVQILRSNQSRINQVNQQYLQQLKQEQSFDKYFKQKKTVNSKLKQVKKTVLSSLKYIDLFGVKPAFNAQPQNYSCFGFSVIALIIILIILTLIGTFRIDGQIKYSILEDLDDQQNAQVILKSTDNFKYAVCFHTVDPIFFLDGPNKNTQLTFYAYKNQKIHVLSSQQMKSAQMSYFGHVPNSLSGFETSNCFRVSDGQQMIMKRSKKDESYIGFKFSPYCNPEHVCTLQDLNNNFATFINKFQIMLLVPQIRYNPTEYTLESGVFQKTISSKKMVTASTAFQKTFHVNAYQLYDVKSPKTQKDMPLQKTLTFSQYLDKKQANTIILNSTEETFYDIKIKYSGQKIIIYSKPVVALQLIGVIGGVILFWCAIFCCFGKKYNNFKCHQKLNEQLYRKTSKTSYFIKILERFLPIGYFLSNKVELQGFRKNIQQLLNYVNLYKTSETLAQISCSLFANQLQRKFSMLYFKTDVNLKNITKMKLSQQDFISDENLTQQSVAQFDPQIKNNKISNNQLMTEEKEGQLHGHLGERTRYLMGSNTNLKQDKSKGDLNMNESNLMFNSHHEFYNEFSQAQIIKMEQKQNYIQLLYKLDIFSSEPQLSINGKTKIKSIFGGISTLVFVVIFILLIVYWAILPDTKQNYEISKFLYVDDLNFVPHSSKIQYNQGIQLKSGYNFKLAISFYQKADDSIFNVSSEISKIGISFFQINLKRHHGEYVIEQIQVPLQSCSNNYFQGWIDEYHDPKQFQNISNAFCLPHNEFFNLKGKSGQNEISYLQLSIFDKTGNSTGKTELSNFLQKYLIKYHISNPIKKSFYDPKLYEVISFSLSQQPQSFPVQRNISFSKYIFQNQVKQNSFSTYGFKYFSQYERSPLIDIYAQHRNDLMFYYSDIVQHTSISLYAGIQYFGLFGGCLFLLIAICWCCVSSFNKYKMTYIIGKKLYLFEEYKKHKVQINSKKQKQKNTITEFQLFKSWILLPMTYISSDLYFGQKYNKINAIQKIVELDLNIYCFYKKIFALKQALNHYVKLQDYPNVKLANIFIKKIYNGQTVELQYEDVHKEGIKHELSSYEQYIMQKYLAKQTKQHQKPFQDKQFIKLKTQNQISKKEERYDFSQKQTYQRIQVKQIQQKKDKQDYEPNLIFTLEKDQIEEKNNNNKEVIEQKHENNEEKKVVEQEPAKQGGQFDFDFENIQEDN